MATWFTRHKSIDCIFLRPRHISINDIITKMLENSKYSYLKNLEGDIISEMFTTCFKTEFENIWKRTFFAG